MRGVGNLQLYYGIFLTLELNGLITLTSRAAQEHVAVAHILEHNGTIILWMKSFFHICMFCICYVYIFVYTVVTICAMDAFFRFSVQNYVFFPYLPNLLAGKVINISILPCFYGISSHINDSNRHHHDSSHLTDSIAGHPHEQGENGSSEESHNHETRNFVLLVKQYFFSCFIGYFSLERYY